MSDMKGDYKVGYRKPPTGRRFQKGQSGKPRGPRRENLSALLIAAGLRHDRRAPAQDYQARGDRQTDGHQIGVYKEKGSGAKADRIERKKVMALAQAREIDAIPVAELSRWGRSTIDLVQTLQSLQAWDVSVLAILGLQFDLSTPHGKMTASVMAALAEFERDLIRERIKSGIAAAKARGKRLGRQPGQRPSDRKATKVLKLAEAGLSYRLIGRHVGLSRNTVGAILQRARAANQRKQV